MIISVSRRCDIPRFDFDWFLERLGAGFVEVQNPFNPRQVRRVSLLPAVAASSEAFGCGDREGADLFVFWTRDPARILEHHKDLEGRAFYVMVTLTNYPGLLEPMAPPPEAVIQTMAALAQKITPDRVIWRYDPVFLSNLSNYKFHRLNFTSLAAKLKGSVNKVIVSVYDEYKKAEKRLSELERGGLLKLLPHYAGVDASIRERPLLPELVELLADMAEIAHSRGMEIQSCAEEGLTEGCRGIKSGACIDGEYISRLFGLKNPGRDKGQGRPRCLCAQSVDIGSYGRCPAGCVYCYAH